MSDRIKVLELSLNQPLETLTGLDGYHSIRALLRWNTEPVGYLELPLKQGRCEAAILRAALLKTHRDSLLRAVVRKDLEAPPENASPVRGPGDISTPDDKPPPVSVAVCTRDRTEQLKDCLDSLRRLSYPNIEVLVIDNAPATEATRELLQAHYPEFRYVREPRPGLDWARNRAIIEASGDILAYTDDDVVVDPLWVDGLVRVFQADPAVMAVTGLVAPFEMETHTQILFERYGGFGRGFRRVWYHLNGVDGRKTSIHIGAGRFGTGANMAYRRSVFDRIGPFDPALDVGTVTNGGGDLEMFFRVLEEGHTLVYEPAALVWHRHRRTLPELRTQLANNGVGFYSYLVRAGMHYPARRADLVRFGLWWFWYWNLRRLLKSFIVRPRVPRALILAELRGALSGLTRYQKARRRAEQIRTEFPDEPQVRDVGTGVNTGMRQQAAT